MHAHYLVIKNPQYSPALPLEIFCRLLYLKTNKWYGPFENSMHDMDTKLKFFTY